MYFAYTLAVGGWRFGQIVFYILEIAQPTQLVNDYLFAAAFSLFSLRFLFGKSPRFRATPYLHLPIPRKRLVRYFQVSSLVSLHNLYPLIFVVAYWLNEVQRINPVPLGSYLWLGGVVCILLSSTWLNGWLRAVLSNQARLFALIVVAAWLVVGVDQVLGTFVINDFSRSTFNALLTGDLTTMGILVGMTVAAWIVSSRRLLRSLRHSESAPGGTGKVYRDITLLQDLGPVGQLVVLEVKMLWRNRRPRHNLLLSTIFSTLYVIALLLTPGLGDTVVVQSVVGLFASGGFALNYGQLMFAWESSFLDGLLARDISASTIVRAKYLILQLSCVAFFALSLPIFAILRPELIMLHVAFTVYNAGITSLLMMILALTNRRRVELWRSGSFFNYEGFSFLHWLWILPVAVPPLALIAMLPRVQAQAALLIALLGLLGLLLTPILVDILAERFDRNRYAMLSGFRTR